jgi:hypothetical protein
LKANSGEHAMLVFDLGAEQVFDPERNAEKILAKVRERDVTIACREPGRTSPNHPHPNATEFCFCFSADGEMRTPSGAVPNGPGSFVAHPRRELHEYVNGSQRTLLFRVRHGAGMSTRGKDWPTNDSFHANPEDVAFFQEHPDGVAA